MADVPTKPLLEPEEGPLTFSRKLAEQTIQSLFGHASTALFTYDEGGGIRIWNKALENLLGLSGEAVSEKTLFDLVPKGNDVQRTEGIIQAIFNGKELTDIHSEIKTGTGEIRYLSISTFPAREGTGPVIFGIAIVTNVTEKKQLEQALLQTEKMAALGTLGSGLAHEMGTPMNVILGRAESILKHTKEEKTEKGLKIIIEQIDRMTRLIKHLLAFARRKPIEKKRVHIGRTIEKAIEIVEQQIGAKGISVITNLDPDLPALRGDGDQILQVLVNLFMNAIDAIHKKGEIRITTSLTKIERRGKVRGESPSDENQMIRILFEDNGSGIDPSHLNKIFDPFFTTKPVGKGTGLGLAVAHGIVRDHGGQIKVTSIVGKETTFCILLPIR